MPNDGARSCLPSGTKDNNLIAAFLTDEKAITTRCASLKYENAKGCSGRSCVGMEAGENLVPEGDDGGHDGMRRRTFPPRSRRNGNKSDDVSGSKAELENRR